jgi:hypothetical protein
LSQHYWQSEWLQPLLFTIKASSWHTGQVSIALYRGATVFLLAKMRFSWLIFSRSITYNSA